MYAGEQMILRNIHLKDYRNYGKESFSFDRQLQIILGNNAQGKTNLLEAVYLVCMGRSFRSPRLRETYGDFRNPFELSYLFEEDGRELRLELRAGEKSGMSMELNHVKLERRSDLFGLFPMVLFSPDHLRTFTQGPSLRRAFLDREISLVSRAYFHQLVRYNKTLLARNALLKSDVVDIRQLEVYEEALSVYGLDVTKRRGAFLQKLSSYARSMHERLTSGSEELAMTYHGCGAHDSEEYLFNLQQNRERDRRVGFTGYGPHADDLRISLNGKDLRKYGSQGQIRLGALSVYFSLVPFIEEQLEIKPILLLDDVFSELDRQRRNQLLEIFTQHQKIITATDLDGLDSSLCERVGTIWIEGGRLAGGKIDRQE